MGPRPRHEGRRDGRAADAGRPRGRAPRPRSGPVLRRVHPHEPPARPAAAGPGRARDAGRVRHLVGRTGRHDRGRHHDRRDGRHGHDRLGDRRDPRGDGRPLPGRRLQRRQRAHRERDRARRHHLELRRLVGRGRGGAPGDPPDAARRRGRRRSRRGGGAVPVALRPRRPVLDVRLGDHRRELPARGAGGRRPGERVLLQHLPRRLLGALAAHPLRGVSRAWPRRRPPAPSW